MNKKEGKQKKGRGGGTPPPRRPFLPMTDFPSTQTGCKV